MDETEFNLPQIGYFKKILNREFKKKLERAAEWEASKMRSWIDNPWTLHAALYADLHFVLSTLNDQMKNRPKSILGNHLQVIDYYVQDVLELAQPFVGFRKQLVECVRDVYECLREHDLRWTDRGRKMLERMHTTTTPGEGDFTRSDNCARLILRLKDLAEETYLVQVLATYQCPGGEVSYPMIHGVDVPMIKAAYGSILRKGNAPTETYTAGSLSGSRSTSLLTLRVLAELGLYDGHKKGASAQVLKKVREIMTSLQLTKSAITGK